MRIALAILLDTAALILWNIGTRSPARLVNDVRAGLLRTSTAVRGVARFLTGLLALVLAAAVTAPLNTHATDTTVLESGALITALLLEQVLSPGLNSARRVPRR